MNNLQQLISQDQHRFLSEGLHAKYDSQGNKMFSDVVNKDDLVGQCSALTAVGQVTERLDNEWQDIKRTIDEMRTGCTNGVCQVSAQELALILDSWEPAFK